MTKAPDLRGVVLSTFDQGLAQAATAKGESARVDLRDFGFLAPEERLKLRKTAVREVLSVAATALQS